jgi:hypothetical protein
MQNEPSQPPTKRKLFIYVLGFLVLVLISFIAYSAYKLYNNKPPKAPAAQVIGTQACAPDGICKVYPKAYAAKVCPKVYQTANCDNQCGDKANLCSQ